MAAADWPWDSYTLSAIATHLGRTWVYRSSPRVAVEQDVSPWTAITVVGWAKTELAVAPRGRHGATGENRGLYLRRVQRILFNPETRQTVQSITFVAGKSQVTIFADGTYAGGSSAGVPHGEAQPGARPRRVDESPAWQTQLKRMYSQHAVIAEQPRIA